MYSGYGGSPSRTLSTMSLSVRPVRRLTSRSITRSQSFTGVNNYDKPYRNLSVFSTPGLSRKPSRASRMFTMSTKSNPPPKVPQPERLDQVYEALRKGLQSYLQVHQMDLDNLSRQMKESKRNSRLGFLYELDKQVKVTERYIRRLEFHLSKIEELYEAYCLQRRLRDGADKMVKAYTASLSSKEARESLTEANKGYKEYTENMCVLESELENQLGEFHIKMKGLAGFARLCAGDQYEIFMRYGRQRWKLRGRIEINSKQVWDSEEMVLLPLVNDFLSVKVTELKSLANHVVVGSISCETKDLFAALPQTVAVDINDLGTVKLSLEVTWNPFDKDDQGSMASSVNKPPTVSKRFSTIFNQSPPDTPSLREQAFYSLPRSLTRRQHWPLLDIFRDTLSQSCSCSDKSPTRQPTANMLRRHEELENGTAWSNSSESSDDSSSPQLSAGGPRNSTHHKAVVVTPEIQPTATERSSPQPDISFSLRDSSSQTPKSTYMVCSVSEVANTTHHPTESNREEDKGTATEMTKPDSEEEDAGKQSPTATGDGLVTNSHTSHSYSRSLSHISESSADGIVLTDRSAGESGEEISLASGISINDIEMELPSRTPELPSSAATDTDMSPRRLDVVEENTTVNDVTDQHPIRLPQDTSSSVLTSFSPRTEGMNSSPPSQMNTLPHLECNIVPESGDATYSARRVSVEEEMPCADADCLSREGDGPVDCGLEDALAVVVSSLDDYRGQFPELQLLEQELKLLQVTLKGGRHSRSPSVASLTVETALGSFDFLNMSDWEEDEEERSDKRNRNGRSLQDRGWDSPSSPTLPLTTGCTTLDCSLVVHLKNCNAQLLRLGMFGPLRCGEMYALDRLLREARVLENIRRLTRDNPRRLRQPDEVIPQLGLCLGAVSLWQQCVGQGSKYSVSAEDFLDTLSTAFSSILPEMVSSMADKERVLDQRLPRRGSSRDGVMLTLFQLWSYVEANGISDMETHITELAEEVWLVQRLASSDLDVIVHTLRRPAECSLRREGLHAVAKLLKDPRGKVSASASSVLRSLAAQPRQREQALVSCLELLEDEKVDTRVCGCKALACLKAKESIDQLVYLCRTDKEEVRDAAKQTLLVLGEEGKMAHRHVETSQDSIPRLFAPGSMASTAF
ncbi:rho family-interacting cell polarization regulator 1 isoform X2 [Hippoglossus hippoglossus]|uniref:rho family-interacting cell polarization regulator 1 isoform X2 n=1 Tax=Hippoglossus hippoglossus TaxID=8267 RepID=UPI00148C8F5F|nr:rho family-interacting cell polarization regulator 1 isoform X2 [Hippoglossus hippoglossus]